MNRSDSLHRIVLAMLPATLLAAAPLLAADAANTAAADPAASAEPGATVEQGLPAKGAWMRHGPGAWGGGPQAGLLGILRKLNLSAAQQDQVHGILAGARAQMQSDRQGEIADLPALGNPADPQHAAAVQAAQARAADRIQRESDLQQQVYNVLTPAQQAQVPQLLAALQQRLAAHAAARHAAHP